MDRTRRLIALASILGLLVTACTGASSPAPAASTPTGSAAAPTDAAGTPKTGSLNFALSGPSLIYVPTLVTLTRLGELGYTVDIIETGSNSVMMQAAVDGLVHMVSPTVAAQMAAIDAGWEAKWILQRSFNEFVLVAKTEFATCDSLAGQVLAIHAETDTTGLLAKDWITENCTAGTTPELQLVPGSENRLVGLLQNQLAASPLELQDWQNLEAERPGEFHIIANWVEEKPLVAGVYAVDPEWLADNEEMAKDFIRIHLEVWEELAGDEALLLETAKEYLPEADPEILAGVVHDYLELGIYPVGGGLDLTKVQTSLDFFSGVGEFTNVPTA